MPDFGLPDYLLYASRLKLSFSNVALLLLLAREKGSRLVGEEYDIFARKKAHYLIRLLGVTVSCQRKKFS